MQSFWKAQRIHITGPCMLHITVQVSQRGKCYLWWNINSIRRISYLHFLLKVLSFDEENIRKANIDITFSFIDTNSIGLFFLFVSISSKFFFIFRKMYGHQRGCKNPNKINRKWPTNFLSTFSHLRLWHDW